MRTKDYGIGSHKERDKIMIKSMTGFGRCEVMDGDRKFTVEMKSVNHRYLDVNIKMPKKLNFFEAAIRAELKNYIQRGKVDIFITYEDFSEGGEGLSYLRQSLKLKRHKDCGNPYHCRE